MWERPCPLASPLHQAQVPQHKVSNELKVSKLRPGLEELLTEAILCKSQFPLKRLRRESCKKTSMAFGSNRFYWTLIGSLLASPLLRLMPLLFLQLQRGRRAKGDESGALLQQGRHVREPPIHLLGVAIPHTSKIPASPPFHFTISEWRGSQIC